LSADHTRRDICQEKRICCVHSVRNRAY
jgi:hypothetical protein